MFYVYLWLRENGAPYYVGKGTGRRGFTSVRHSVHRPKSRANILVQEYETETEAFDAEKFFIDFYGRMDSGTGCLYNHADGGLGGSAAANGRYQRTERHRAILQKNMLGNQRAAGHPNAKGRLRTMTPEQRSAQARKAASTRWRGIAIR